MNIKNNQRRNLARLLIVAIIPWLCTAQAQVPQILSYQGRVAVGGVNFPSTGGSATGNFKFALVSGDGSATYWTNDGAMPPVAEVPLTVTNGLYSVLLGDTTVTNMTSAIPVSTFTNADVCVRVWFDDGSHGVQQLAPDQRIAAVGYAMVAGGVALPTTAVEPNGLIGVITLGGEPFLHGFGAQNVFVGSSVGNFTMTGAGGNAAVGCQVLPMNTTGYWNTGIGYNVLTANTTGLKNTAIGTYTLSSNTTGQANVALGVGTLTANTTGTNNVAIGSSAGEGLATGDNNIDILTAGMAGESNTLRIGTEGVLKAAYIAAISGTSVSGSAVVVNTSGQLGVAGSSERFKEKIAEIGNGSEVLYRLQPMSFRYKPGIDAAGTPQFGLIAEQVDRVDPDLVVRDAKGQIFTVRYEAVNAMLLNEFLKEHRRVEEVRSTIAKQETTIAELSDTLARQQKVMESLRETVEVLARKIGTPLPEGTLR